MKDNITLIVKPTHRCNLSCPYCYDLKNRKVKEEMNQETIDQIIKVFKNANVVEWIWHGGEPLLMGVDYIRESNKKVLEHMPNTSIEVQTNGVLINDEYMQLFNEFDMRPGLSFDGIKNEFTRKNTGKLMNTFNILERNNITPGAIMVVTQDNIKNLIEEYEYAKRLNIGLKMNLVFEAQGNDNAKNLMYKDAIKSICDYFDYWIKDTNRPMHSPLAQEFIDMLTGGRTTCENIDCVGRWFGIHPNGDIVPCGRDWNEDYVFGNIHDYNSYEEIYEHENFKKYRQQTRCINNHCKDSKCPFFKACYSGCSANNINYFIKEGKLEPEKTSCIIQKSVLKHVFKVINSIDYSNPDVAKQYNPHFISILNRNQVKSVALIKEILKDLNLLNNKEC